MTQQRPTMTRALPPSAHDRVCALLSTALGHPVTLGVPQLLKAPTRASVWRVPVSGTALPYGAVIVKLLGDDDATAYTEWAALAFLAELSAARGLVPAFLGGDTRARLLLLEDLGPGRTLHEVLTDDTAAAATTVLNQLAAQMARLHAATRGAEARFATLRAALPGATATGRQQEAAAWLAAWPRVEGWFAAHGLALPPGLEGCRRQIAHSYAEPGPWLSFSHGDPAPTNNHVGVQGVRLLDFEYAAYRHALYDITAWNVLCPLPPDLVTQMRQTFQQTLAATLQQAGEPIHFAMAWAELCAFRALAVLSWISLDVLAADQPFAPGWSAREAVLAALTRVSGVSASVPALEPLVQVCDALCNALRVRWDEFATRDEVSTHWPALERVVSQSPQEVEARR
jgi:hypothetical protein